MIGAIVIAVVVLLAVWVFFYFVPVGLWISAIAAGVPVGPVTFIGMRLRKVNPHRVVGPMIAAWKAGLELAVSDLEAHYLAGGERGAGGAGPDLGGQGRDTAGFQARGGHRPRGA